MALGVRLQDTKEHISEVFSDFYPYYVMSESKEMKRVATVSLTLIVLADDPTYPSTYGVNADCIELLCFCFWICRAVLNQNIYSPKNKRYHVDKSADGPLKAPTVTSLWVRCLSLLDSSR
jgi:hypothetical protein